MGAKNIKMLFWLLLFGLLLMPCIQHSLGLFKLLPLSGAYSEAPDVEFSMDGWWEGTYQDQKARYVNDNVGFRPDLVRINSQIGISLFDVIHDGKVGKERYLYFQGYIDAWFGSDYLGDSVLQDMAFKLSYLHKVFDRRNKTFVFVHPASKAEFFPEYFPDQPGKKKGRTNYETLKRYFDSLGVPQIDFNALLVSKKGKVEGKIFNRTGIHWTRYGAMYAVDSLVKYIEKQRKIDLPNPEWNTILKTDQPRGRDNDLARTSNLIFPIEETYYYPEIHFAEDTVKNKPSAVYIGDSFTWMLIEDSLMTHTHSKWEFWYYFNTVYTEKSMRDEESEQSIPDYNWKEKLDMADCIVVIFVASEFHSMRKFIDDTYEYYQGQEVSATP